MHNHCADIAPSAQFLLNIQDRLQHGEVHAVMLVGSVQLHIGNIVFDGEEDSIIHGEVLKKESDTEATSLQQRGQPTALIDCTLGVKLSRFQRTANDMHLPACRLQ